jgi:hypothetical protein
MPATEHGEWSSRPPLPCRHRGGCACGDATGAEIATARNHVGIRGGLASPGNGDRPTISEGAVEGHTDRPTPESVPAGVLRVQQFQD